MKQYLIRGTHVCLNSIIGLTNPVITYPLETADDIKLAGLENFRIVNRGGPLLGRGAPTVASEDLVPPPTVQTCSGVHEKRYEEE